MSYSIDLRRRAVSYVRSGGTQTEASKIFQVSRKTLYTWLNRQDLTPKKPTGRKRKVDLKALSDHVKAHPDMYLRERAAHFGVHINAIWVGLQRLKIVKKNDALQANMSSK